MKMQGPLISGNMLTNRENFELLLSPWDGSPIAKIYYASQSDILNVIEEQDRAFLETKKWSSFERSECLKKIASLINRDKSACAELITEESSKPISASHAEVDRAIYTFETAAEEVKHIKGNLIPLDTLSNHNEREAIHVSIARGPVTAITPFNFPLNLVAHKVAPAIASGNPIIIKPAPQTPMTAIKLAQLIIEAGWPKEAIAVLPCENQVAEILVTDDRIKYLSFTGSDTVGWHLKKLAYKKSVTLELGGNAANIVHKDASQSYALSRILWGGFVNAGQTCVSVQRVFVHIDIYKQFREKLIDEIKTISFGDPRDQNTVVGPLISDSAASKIMTLIESAIKKGACCLVGGKRKGNVIEPTLIETDDDTLSICQEEIFGPVILISQYETIDEVIRRVNNSRYGLQAGLFTRDLYTVKQANDELNVGGLNINDVSTFRIDHMPYGGVKASGCGREGLKYAIREMMETKLITYNYPDEEKTD